MVLEVRTLELTVVNATDLKKVKKLKQQRCYVLAYIYPAQRQATLVDTTGGVNPTWNASLSLNCYESDLHPDGSGGAYKSSSTTSSSSRSITIDIYSHSSGFFTRGNDKVVGTVVVPLQHIASIVHVAGISVMSFDVRRPSGKIQGNLNLIVKLGEKRTITEGEQQPPQYAYYDKSKVDISPMMPPLATSYNTASSAPSTQGVYNPGFNTFDNQDVQTGYPAGYGYIPWDPLSTAKPQAPAQRPPVSQTPDNTRQPKKQSRRATKAGRERRKSHLTTAALVVGGVILAAIII